MTFSLGSRWKLETRVSYITTRKVIVFPSLITSNADLLVYNFQLSGYYLSKDGRGIKKKSEAYAVVRRAE